MLKNITKWLVKVFFLFVLCVGYANAGPVKKITGVATSYLIKYEAKKIARKQAKKYTEKLVANEIKVASYGDLKMINRLQNKNKLINNEAHHIPSEKFMRRYGVNADDAVAINVEEFRHRLTSSFAARNIALLNKKESARQAMARDIRNMRDIYRYEKKDVLKRLPNESDSDYFLRDKKYETNLREGLQKVIKENKTRFPIIFKK